MKRFDMRVSLAVCLAAMIWGAVAHAETGSTFVMGSGQDSCGKFIAAVGDASPGKYREINAGVFVSENEAYLQWLMGFVSGVNAASVGEQEQQVSWADSAAMDLWMRNWCNQHPTQDFVQAAMAFVREMRINAATRR